MAPRDRQTDRQKQRQRDRDRDRQTDRQTDRRDGIGKRRDRGCEEGGRR